MRLTKLDIEVTSRCNLNCRYCFLHKPQKDINTDELVRFIHDTGRIKSIRSICLTGGEPFLNPDLDKIISAISLYRINYSILSNGGLITEKIADYINGTDLCVSIQISVDGPDAETHDSFRGPGAFDGAINGINILKKYNIPIDTRITVNKKNYSKLRSTVKFILEDLGIGKVGTNSVDCIGACKDVFSEVSLSAQERAEAIRVFLELHQEYPGRLVSLAGPLAEGLWWNGFVSHRNQGGHLTACGCVFDKLAIKSNGNIVPCMFLDDFVLGKISKNSLLTIFYNSDILNKIRTRRLIPLSEFEVCQNCDFIEECTGGCPATVYFESGILDAPSKDGCRKLFLRDGGAL